MRSSPICMPLPLGNDRYNRLITGGQAVENELMNWGKPVGSDCAPGA